MRPAGRSYLVEVEPDKDRIVDGVLIPGAGNAARLAHYRGVVRAAGLGFGPGEAGLKEGDRVLFDWRKKEGKVKLMLAGRLYYAVPEDLVLAVEEEGAE